MISEDDNFQRFADTLERTIASYGQEDLTSDQLLVKQCSSSKNCVGWRLVFAKPSVAGNTAPACTRSSSISSASRTATSSLVAALLP
jgi:hypothetical protein